MALIGQIESPARTERAERSAERAGTPRRLADAIALALVLAFAVAVVLSSSALARGAIGRDAGVFLYAGQRLLAGGVPYIDFWDHKGPVIYYLNALGLLIGGGSPVGVLAVECASLAAAALVGYLLLRREFGRAAALVASAAWLVGAAPALGEGNFTEEYALPAQFLALYLAAGRLNGTRRRSVARWFAVGALGGLLFLLKPSLVGVAIAAGLALLSRGVVERHWRATATGLAGLIVGTVAVLSAVAVGLAARGALASAFDQIVVYNAAYSHATSVGVPALLRALASTLVGAGNLLPLPLLTAAGVGGAAAIVLALLRVAGLWFGGSLVRVAGTGFHPAPRSPAGSPASGNGLDAGAEYARLATATVDRDAPTDAASLRKPRRALTFGLPVLIALLDMPIEALLVALTGRGYEHYFLAWLPGLAILTGCAAAIAVRGAHRFRQGNGRLAASIATGTAVLLLVIALWSAPIALRRLPENLAGLPRLNERLADSETARVIDELSEPGDTVLVWGAETTQNFLSGRKSPTRYTYQYPLYTPGYARDELAAELLRDLRERRPRLILDTAETNTSVPPLDGPSRKAWAVERAPKAELRGVLTPEMSEVFAHIQRQYRLERTFGYNWKVYRLTDEVIPAEQAAPSVALDLRLGREFALRGYDLPRARVQPGDKLTVTLYWEPLAVPSRDYTVFVHLVGADGRPIAQKDGYPLDGRYPTSLWRPGEVVRDGVELTVPPGTAGSYTLLAGMYDLKTMERLPISGASGGVGDGVEVGRIEVGD